MSNRIGESPAVQAPVSKPVTNERVIESLLALWTGVPSQRFGQLVMNVSRIEGGFADTWEWSNATWVQRIEDGMRTWARFPAFDTETAQQSTPPSSPSPGEDEKGLRVEWPELRETAPLDLEAVLWVAALGRVPIKERIEWVAQMKGRVEGINAARAFDTDEPQGSSPTSSGSGSEGGADALAWQAEGAIGERAVLALVERVRLLEAVAEAARRHESVRASFRVGTGANWSDVDLAQRQFLAALAAAGGGAHE